MAKIVNNIVLFTLMVLMSSAFSGAPTKPDFMPIKIARKRFGGKEFDAKIFKASNIVTRASMAADLVQSKRYVGQLRSKVRRELGTPNGYYISETFLAYLIHIKREEPQEAWQILFIPNRDGKIIDVKIHNQVITN